MARNLRVPTKSDSGEANGEDLQASAPAGLPDLLVKQVPVGVVAAYTAATAGLVALVQKPSGANPSPDQMLSFRWTLFAALIVASVILTYVSYRAKAEPKARFPVPELIGVALAAAAWGLLVPESPLQAMQPTPTRAAGVVVLVGFVGTLANLIVAAQLQRSAK